MACSLIPWANFVCLIRRVDPLPKLSYEADPIISWAHQTISRFWCKIFVVAICIQLTCISIVNMIPVASWWKQRHFWYGILLSLPYLIHFDACHGSKKVGNPCKVIHYRRSGQSIHHIAARKRKCFASMKRYCKYWIIITDNFLDDFSGTLDDQLRNTTYEKVGSFVSIRCATRGKLLMEENELLNFGNLKFYSLYCNNWKEPLFFISVARHKMLTFL